MGKIKVQNHIDTKKDYDTDNMSNMSAKNLPQIQQLQQTPKEKEDQILLYQIFPSSNRFLCGGRLLQSQFPRPFIFAVSLIVIPVTLHIVFQLTYGYYQAIFTAFTFTFMFITAFRDPGILPRVENLTNDYDLDQIPIDRSKENNNGFILIDSNGLTMNYKVCDTCGIYKDKDRKHCRVCDNCVSGFDHHCIWLNNCIGKNNYKTFILFLFFLIAQLIYTIISSASHINLKVNEKVNLNSMSRTEAIKSVLQKQPLPIFLIIYSFLFLLLVGTLFLYHVYLIFNDTSTVEQRKILSFRKAEWKKHFQTKYWYSLKKKFLCLIPQPLMNFREPIYFKETKKFIFIKENKKDSESVTQIANAKDARTNKNVETNIIDFQSFNKQDIIQEQGILQQPAFVKDLKIIENKDDNKVCIKGICVEDVKEEILNAQPLNLFSKNRSLQLIEIGNYHHIENYKQE